ncbi:MAG: hypothetical protein ABW224_20525 [Kibdelosporangium sp.]
MIDESDPAVRAMRAQFAQISARHTTNVDQTVTEYQQGAAANKAYQEEVARRETEMLASPLEPRNQWQARKRAAPAEGDGTETGYYTGSFMERG